MRMPRWLSCRGQQGGACSESVAALCELSVRSQGRAGVDRACEVVHVGSWMPIVFIEQAGRYVLMAMMSPMPGHNLFVGPDGEWLGGPRARPR